MVLFAENGQKFDLFAYNKKDKMKWLSEISYAIQLGDGASPIKSKKKSIKEENLSQENSKILDFDKSYQSIKLVKIDEPNG